MLVGGLGADRIVGNADDDILIAGRTTLNAGGVDAVIQQWTKENVDIDARQTAVGQYLVTSGENAPVFDDGQKDALTGSSGVDWFFANLEGEGVLDKITDLKDDAFASDLEFILP